MPKSESKDSPLERYISILEMIGPHIQGLTAQELERSLDLPKATTNRLIHVLVNSGLLEPSTSRARAYRLGPRILGLVQDAGDISWLQRLTEKPLQSVANETGLSAFLCRRVGMDVLSVNCASPDSSVRFYIEPGISMPINAAATGKAIWAHQKDRAAAISAGMTQFTEDTITSVAALEQELDLICARGYALENNEHVSGLASLAVPIKAPDGTVTFALGLTGGRDIVVAHMEDLVTLLRDSSAKFSEILRLPNL